MSGQPSPGRGDIDAAWRDDAACLSTDPEVFFPLPGAHTGWDAPRAICGYCPVAAECLADALATEGPVKAASRWGMRGGLTPDQRAALHRRAKRKARAT